MRKKYQEELPTLKMLMCANRRKSFTPNLFSQKHIKEIKIEQAYE